MTHAKGSSRKFIGYGRIYFSIIAPSISLVKRNQSKALHLLRSNNNRQELVVRYVLHFRNDNAPCLLEEPFISGRRIQLLQNVRYSIVLASKKNLKGDEWYDLIGAAVPWNNWWAT